MKCTYITPESQAIALATSQMAATSVIIGEETIDNAEDILTKEDKSSGTGLWDSEW